MQSELAALAMKLQGGPKSKPLAELSLSLIKPVSKLDFSSNLIVKEALKYSKLLLNVLCVTQFMRSLITFKVGIYGIYIRQIIVIENPKKKHDRNFFKFYINFKLNSGL